VQVTFGRKEESPEEGRKAGAIGRKEGRGPSFLEQKGNPNKIQTLFPTCGPMCYIFLKTRLTKKRKEKKGFFFILE
jgi:hypothetical protein